MLGPVSAASLTITDNASNSPQTVALTGKGVAGMLTVTPTSLSFGEDSDRNRQCAQADHCGKRDRRDLHDYQPGKHGRGVCGQRMHLCRRIPVAKSG